MNPPDAFAPPKSVVADVDTEATTPRIPMWFKVMLIAYMALNMAGNVANAEFRGLVWFGVMAIATWQTLKGHRAASRLLGALLVLSAALLALSATNAFTRGRFIEGGVYVAFTGYAAALAACLFFHPTLQAVFRRADRKKWSG